MKRLNLLFLLLSSPALALAQVPDRYFPPVRKFFEGERAFQTVSFVEQRWRVVGNRGFNESIARVETLLQEAGYVPESEAKAKDVLTYRIEKRPMSRPAWDPVSARVTIVGENRPLLDFSTNRNMIAIYSATTPPEGIEAEVVDVGKGRTEDFEGQDVTGKIVLAEGFMSGIYRNAVSHGALGVMTYFVPAYNQPEKHIHSISFGSIPFDPTGNQRWGIFLSNNALHQLKSALAAGKNRVRVQIESQTYPSEEQTIIAEIRGNLKPKERFVFSAHVQEPGANDNASGVGTLAEMARVAAVMVKNGTYRPHRTLTFLWGDEIISTHRYITEDSLRAHGIRWGMSLDMVGEDTRKTGGTFLIEKMPDPSAVWTRGEDQHTEWGGSPLPVSAIRPHYYNDFTLRRCQEQGKYAQWTVRTNPFEGGSDHTPFLDANKPGLLMWHFTDVFYHTDQDRLENVSPKTMTNVGTCALVTAMTLTSGTERTAQQILHELQTAATQRLSAEFALSKAALENDEEVTEQRLILETWRDYYIHATQAVEDVLTQKPSATLKQQILRTQNEIRQYAKTYLDQLKP